MTADDTYAILRFAVKHEICDMLFWSGDAGPFWKDPRPDIGELHCALNCNDLFEWACADAEEITVADLPAIEQAIADCLAVEPVGGMLDGCILYAARKRKMRPQNCCYPEEQELWPLFDACGPERPDDSTKRKMRSN